MTPLHVAAALGRSRDVRAILLLPLARLRDERDEARLALRKAAVEQGITLAPGGTKRKDQAWLFQELDAIERTFHMKREAALQSLLRAKDAYGRSAMHLAAASQGGAIDELLEARTGADLRAMGPSGYPLFPAGAFVEQGSGAVTLPFEHPHGGSGGGRSTAGSS